MENKVYIKMYIKKKRELFSKALKVIDGWDGIPESYVNDVAQMIKLENNQSYLRDQYNCLRELLRSHYLTKDEWNRLQKDMEDRGLVL